MTNKAEAQAQRIWVELGGIGPVPRQMVNAMHSGGVSVNDPSADYWRCKATKLRHRTRLRLVASALAGTSANIVSSDIASAANGVTLAAFAIADAALARLDAEAKGGERKGDE